MGTEDEGSADGKVTVRSRSSGLWRRVVLR